MNYKISFSGLNGFTLKYIAMAAMTLDHFACVLLSSEAPLYILFRGIGRIAFPIYCFLLVEGFVHTSNQKAYFQRLLIFAFISEVPFDMALYHFPLVTASKVLFQHQNVFFTLAFGILTMICLDHYWFRNQSWGLIGAILLGGAAELFHFDYGLAGILLIAVLFVCKRFRPNLAPWMRAVFAVLPLFSTQTISDACVVLAIPLLTVYNGQKGSPLPGGKSFPGAKHLFYLYYPLHLFVISTIYFL